MEANLSGADTLSLTPKACLLFNRPGTKLGECPFLGRPENVHRELSPNKEDNAFMKQK